MTDSKRFPALIIRPPFAALMVHSLCGPDELLRRTAEYRTFGTDYRGPLVIVQSGSSPDLDKVNRLSARVADHKLVLDFVRHGDRWTYRTVGLVELVAVHDMRLAPSSERHRLTQAAINNPCGSEGYYWEFEPHASHPLPPLRFDRVCCGCIEHRGKATLAGHQAGGHVRLQHVQIPIGELPLSMR